MKLISEIYTKAHNYHWLNPLAVAAQTYHETGGYKHFRDWNLAGIKCTKSWTRSGGKCWEAKTFEYYGGEKQDITAGFRAYNNLEHFLSDYADLIGRLYVRCAANHDSTFGYFAGLHGKWATDPKYFKHLVRLAFQLAPQVTSHWNPKADLDLAVSRNALEKWQIEYIRTFPIETPVKKPPVIVEPGLELEPEKPEEPAAKPEPLPQPEPATKATPTLWEVLVSWLLKLLKIA